MLPEASLALPSDLCKMGALNIMNRGVSVHVYRSVSSIQHSVCVCSGQQRLVELGLRDDRRMPAMCFAVLHSAVLHRTRELKNEEKIRQPAVTAAVVVLFDLIMLATVAASGIALSLSLESCCRHTSHHSFNSGLLFSSSLLSSRRLSSPRTN
jgi:hypothetical protein